MGKLKVNETRKRSLLKAISFRVIEVGVDTGIIYLAFSNLDKIGELLHLSHLEAAFGLAVVVELMCMLLHFLFERIWNKIDYGRQIIEDKCDT